MASADAVVEAVADAVAEAVEDGGVVGCGVEALAGFRGGENRPGWKNRPLFYSTMHYPTLLTYP